MNLKNHHSPFKIKIQEILDIPNNYPTIADLMREQKVSKKMLIRFITEEI